MTVQSAENVPLLCEYAKVPKHLKLAYICTLDGGTCFLAGDPVLREKCPTKRFKGAKKEAQ